MIDDIRKWAASNSSAQMWLFLGAVIFVSLIVFFVMVNLRTRWRHHRPHHHHHPPTPPKTESDDEESSGRGGGFFGQRRRKRKKKRRANPTLAETGGLPQPRDPQKPPNV